MIALEVKERSTVSAANELIDHCWKSLAPQQRRYGNDRSSSVDSPKLGLLNGIERPRYLEIPDIRVMA
jgi:hypothetical protein